LAQGVKWGWIKANPAKEAGTRSPKGSAKPALTTAQLAALCKAALADDEDMAAAIALAALTGCRRGELAGLRWEDLDTEAHTLRVCRQWVPGKGGQQLEDHTKSGTGRTVYIGEPGVALLERYRAALADRIGHDPEGWLLSYNGGTTPLRAKSMTGYFSGLAKRLKIDATLHTLRHWNRTELVAQGVDLATAADQGGHTKEVMASSYLHTDPKRAAAAGELIAGIVVEAIEGG
jgi:integrase